MRIGLLKIPSYQFSIVINVPQTTWKYSYSGIMNIVLVISPETSFWEVLYSMSEYWRTFLYFQRWFPTAFAGFSVIWTSATWQWNLLKLKKTNTNIHAHTDTQTSVKWDNDATTSPQHVRMYVLYIITLVSQLGTRYTLMKADQSRAAYMNLWKDDLE